MTLRLRTLGAACVLLDIEGTTTPIAFVYDVLFPFARASVRQFLSDYGSSPDVRAAIEGLRSEWTDEVSRGNGPPPWPRTKASTDDVGAVASYIEWLMDRDRKSTALKSLQGQIWETGYRTGVLHGEVFGDVPAAFARWRREGIALAIYSSGSVLAQRLLFQSTTSGDLTGFISAFFDTAVGAKTSPDSYRGIASKLNEQTERILFVSDVARELDAARAAGCLVALCERPGNPAQPVQTDTPVVQSLEDIAV